MGKLTEGRSEQWKGIPERVHTAGRVTHFVAGLGTTGTFMGITQRLKKLNPAIRCIRAVFVPQSDGEIPRYARNDKAENEE